MLFFFYVFYLYFTFVFYFHFIVSKFFFPFNIYDLRDFVGYGHFKYKV